MLVTLLKLLYRKTQQQSQESDFIHKLFAIINVSLYLANNFQNQGESMCVVEYPKNTPSHIDSLSADHVGESRNALFDMKMFNLQKQIIAFETGYH